MSVKFALPLLVLIGLGLPSAEAAETSQHATRLQSTNMAMSAPLNLVHRWFARLETHVDSSQWSTERLTFRTHHLESIVNHEKTVEKLLADISGGPHEVRILELTSVSSTETNIRQTLNAFLDSVKLRPEADEAVQKGFRTAINAALTRPDVLLHTARVLRRDEGEARILILSDSETRDLVLLSIGSAN